MTVLSITSEPVVGLFWPVPVYPDAKALNRPLATLSDDEWSEMIATLGELADAYAEAKKCAEACWSAWAPNGREEQRSRWRVGLRRAH